MDDCFSFFAPILNGIAFEFSKCYVQCSKENVDYLKNNIHFTLDENDNGIERETEKQTYEVEKCQNASMRGFVENYYLAVQDLQTCVLATDFEEPENQAKQISSKNEVSRGHHETSNERHPIYRRKTICDTDKKS